MPTKLLISRHDKIGDFVVTLPMFKVLKEQRPEIVLYALVSKINFEFAKQIAFIDHVILFDPNNLQQTLKSVKQAKIDVSISAFIDTKLAWLLYRSGIKKRIAPATKIAQILFNKKITQRRSRVEKKEFEYNLDLLHAFDANLKLEFSQPLIDSITTPEISISNDFLQSNHIQKGDQLIAFHPGSGGSAEGNLSAQDYLELAKSICHFPKIKIVFTFGPDDQEIRQIIATQLNFEAILYNSQGPLFNFCQLLSQFSLFVSTSTGTMHLAAANNINTLSFFGENLVSTPNRWASISEAGKQCNIVLKSNYSNAQLINIKEQLHAILLSQKH